MRQASAKDSSAIEAKRLKLSDEGVRFDAQGRIASECILVEFADVAGNGEPVTGRKRKHAR